MIAPTSSAESVAAMEDVLEVYARAPDPTRPLVCLDECTKQLTREVRVPQAATCGQPAREDYEYERNGVAAIFCAVAPHLGWRCIEERERKTRSDYAAFLRALADEHFEFHFTPKHGSWMNIAEIELSALARGCLARRIPAAPRSRANCAPGSATAIKPPPASAGSSPPPMPA